MPTPGILDRNGVLNTEIEEGIKHEQTTKWKQLLEGIAHNTNSSKLWKLKICLNNRDTDKTDTHEAILTHTQTNNKQTYSTHTSICRLPHRYEDRAILKPVHSITLDPNMPTPFTTTMTLHAIRKTKNTSATGPDGISNLQLKHLGPHAIRTLTNIFNLSLTANSILKWHIYMAQGWELSDISSVSGSRNEEDVSRQTLFCQLGRHIGVH